MSNLFFITLITASLLHTFKCIEGILTFDLYRILMGWTTGIEPVALTVSVGQCRLQTP